MNRRHERYCRVRTMAELQAEQKRLRRMISTNERHLREDMEDIREALSPERLFHEAMGRMAYSSPVMSRVISGIAAAVSLIKGLRR